MSNQELSITKVLVDVVKWSGKLGFLFFIISAIMVSITINDANPSLNWYEMQAGETATVQYIHMDASDNAQVGFAVESDEEPENRNLITVRIIRSSDSSVVWSITAKEHFQNIYLSSGDYRVEVTVFEDTQFIMLSGAFSEGLVGLTAIFVALFAIMMGIFWTVLPFAIAALIIRSISKSSKPTAYPPPRGAPHTDQEPVKVMRARAPKRRPIVIHPDSYFSKMTRNDWVVAGLAIIFFLLFIVEFETVGLVFAVFLGAVVFYNVTEREKTKQRILVLLRHYPETNIEFLSVQLDKKKKDVVKTLQIMILDDGQPIRLNLMQGSVTVVGEIDEKQYTLPSTRGQVEPVTPFPAVTKKVETREEVVVPSREPEPTTHCTGCGEPLVSEVTYCYSCGQKQ
ncbi:MAG: hypothetical protein ACXAD7_22805 [Candidatus Kariarchaeaceae archaeon]|jgi:hypothetical protein